MYPQQLLEWPSDVPPVSVFNLPRCTGRWATVSASLDSAGMPYSRLENAADAHADEISALECSLFDAMQCVPASWTSCRDCTGGIVGCAVTHLRGWNASMANHATAPWQAFSEDDVEFEAGGGKALLDVVSSVAQSKPDWNVIFFAPTTPEHRLEGLREWNGQEDFQSWLEACNLSNSWTAFYVLSKRARANALELVSARGFGFPLDISVYKLCGRGDCFTQFGGVVARADSLAEKALQPRGGPLVAPHSLTMNTSAEC